jgi:two-component system phosphate regulon sensor histidine kinase PhoR
MTFDLILGKQMLTNLLINAVKYTPAGGRIWVASESTGRRLKIDVGDTGIGIPPELLPRIFEKFYRAKSEATNIVEGTGLGLPLVKRIVERHGGDVSVTSEPGKGSVFSVLLPLAE